MPDWMGGEGEEGTLTASQALSRLKNSQPGESGVLALDGEEAMEFIKALTSASDDIPEELKKALESGVLEARVVKVTATKSDIPDLDEKVMKHFTGTRARDDDKFLDARRSVDGVQTSFRQLQEMAEKVIASDSRPKGAKGMAKVILYLIDQIMTQSDLLRDAEQIIMSQRELCEEAKTHLEEYQTHMAIEHGVGPD